jgi:hypothetical protein
VPPQYVRVVAVERSPDDRHAVVLLEYNEPPTVEPYLVLAENTPDGWVAGSGHSAGGLSWIATGAEGEHGVEVEWGQPPMVRWGVRAPDMPEPPPGALRW